MKTEWIAFIGALAWVPALIALLKPHFTRARVRIITEKRVLVGFNNLGPSVSIRVAFAADSKDAVITRLNFGLSHENGERRQFEWKRISQHIGQMNIPNTGSVPFGKVSGVLAMKLNTRDIEERYIQFQNPSVTRSTEPKAQNIYKRYRHLIETKTASIEAFLTTEEVRDYLTDVNQSFNWRPGDYRLSFSVQSPQRCLLRDTEYRFTLSASDVEALERGKSVVVTELKNRLAAMEKRPVERFTWIGRNVNLEKMAE